MRNLIDGGESTVVRLRRGALLCGVATLGALLAVEARAQTAGASQLDEVVVTAERTETNLQKTPLSVTAVPAAVLQQRGATTLLDLGTFTPNLTIISRAGATNSSASFAIRGMGVNAQESQGAVGVYLDEVYFPSSSGNLLGLLDVDRVEVLRGPQGTLFGRNTIGGAVQYITVKPRPTFGGYAQGTMASYNRRDVEGAINIPLGDKFAVRLTGATNHIGGYVSDDFARVDRGQVDTKLGRLQLRWTPTERLTVDLKAELAHQRTNGRAVSIVGVNPGAQFAGLAFILGETRPLTNALLSTKEYHFAGYNDPDYFKSDTRVYQGALRYAVTDTIDFKSISAYSSNNNHISSDLDMTPLSILKTDRGSITDRVFTQEFQLNGRSLGERLRWTVGFYYYDSTSKSIGSSVNIGRAPTVFQDNVNRDVKALAGYGQATFNLTQKLSATAGLRYSDEKVEATNLTDKYARETSFNNTSPHFGLNYQATDDALFYIKASRGFRAGGFTVNSDLAGGALAFGPETAWTYEAGARLEFLDRRLRINPTVFWNDWKNIQFNLLVPLPTTIAIATRNAGDARIKGAELEAQFALTDRILLTGSLSHLDAKYTRIPNLTLATYPFGFLASLPNPATGQVLPGSTVIVPNLALNTPLQQAPKWKYSIGGRYTHPLSGGARVVASADWGWTDDQESAVTISDSIDMPAYGLLNARIQYQAPENRWSLSVYGTNIGNKYYLIGGAGFGRGFTVGLDEADPGRPAEYGVTLRVGF